MINKVLTIVVPTYNMEKYLDKCLSSLIINDENIMNSLEVLVVNDGSKDKSSEIAHHYQDKYPQSFLVIDKNNGNYGSCINRGLKDATGKYIKVLDADDYFDTRQFEHYLKTLSTIDVDLVLTDYDFVSESGDVTGTVSYPFLFEKELSIEECIDNPVFMDIQMHGVTYKRSNLEKISYIQTEGISYTDQEWVFTPICTVNKLFYIKNSLYKYLVGRAGQTVDLSVYHKRVSDREKLVDSMLNSYIGLKSFFSMWWKYICPVNLVHEFEGDKCKFCGINQKDSNSIDITYEKYKSFLDTRIKEVVASIYMSYLIVNRKLSDLPQFDMKIKDFAPEIYYELYNTPVSKFLPYKYIKHWRKTQSLPPAIVSIAYLSLKKIQEKLS